MIQANDSAGIAATRPELDLLRTFDAPRDAIFRIGAQAFAACLAQVQAAR